MGDRGNDRLTEGSGSSDEDGSRYNAVIVIRCPLVGWWLGVVVVRKSVL